MSLAATDGVAYTDLASLQGLKANTPDNLRKAARQFESLFVDMWIRSMRAATASIAADSPLSSSTVRFHEDMLDRQWAVHVAESGGVGLAAVLERQLAPPALAPAAAEAAAGPAEPVAAGDPARSVAGAPGSPAGVPAGGTNPATAPEGPPAPAPTGIDALRAADLTLRAAAAIPAAESAAPADPSDPGPATAGGAVGTAAAPPELPVRLGAFRAPLDGTPEGFVARLLPIAREVGRAAGIDPAAIVAHAALESGWGRHVLHGPDGRPSNNLFGIKAGASWKDATVTVDSLEFEGGRMQPRRSAFRAYASIEHSVRDLVGLLTSNPRYAGVVEAAGSASGYARAIGRSGYATDPGYAAKLRAVLDHPALRAVAGGAGGLASAPRTTGGVAAGGGG